METPGVVLCAVLIAVSLAVLAVRRRRKRPSGFADTVLSLVCIFASCLLVEGLGGVPWLYTMLAIFSLMAIIVRQYRKKGWRLLDIVCGVVYMAAATRLFMGLLSLSWLPAVGVAAAAALHIWKRNTLLSIGASTAVYMLLVQLVF